MIILYGGSFNPPTLAHFEIITLLNKLYTPKYIVLMPVGSRYPKPDLLDSEIRLEMTRIMAKSFSNVIVSDFEIMRPFIGTIRALEYLEEKYQEKPTLAIGADNLISLPTWIEAEKLIKNYPIIVFNRLDTLSNDKVKRFEHNHNIKLDIVEFDFNISATKIRNDIKKYRKFLLPEVYEYISKNKLYQKGKSK